MMPSRGMNALRGKLPRIYQAQCRNLSSSPSTPRSHLRTAPISSRTTIPFPRTTRIAIPSIAAFRYASTQPIPPPAAATTPPSPAATTPPSPVADTTTSFSNIDTITIDEVAKNAIVDPSAIPEQIGYLHAVGVDYGYGITSMIQWVIEHAHISLGLPWWASIVLTAAGLRLMLFPFYLKGSDAMARTAALASVLKPLNQQMVAARKEGNTTAQMAVWRQTRAIKNRAGITGWAMYSPMVGQAVLGFCGYRLLKNMATLPVPGLVDGGFLWLQDLTMTDGYLLLPLMMAGSMHVVFRLGGETGTMPPEMQKFMMWAFPVMIMIFTSYQSGAVALWFLGTGIIGIPQAMALQKPAVRKYFGLAPLYKPKPGEGPENPFQAFLDARSGKTADTSAPEAPHAGGKNAAYMKLQYQSPKIRTARGSPRTIDTTLVAPKIDMVQPRAPPKSIFEQAKDKFDQGKQAVSRMSEQTPEQKKAAEKAEFKKRADAYEKRAAARPAKR